MTGVNLSPKPPPGEWAEKANCQGLPPEWFYPERGESTAPAKAVCQSCVVAGPCLEWALSYPMESAGIYAGTSSRDRRRILRERREAS